MLNEGIQDKAALKFIFLAGGRDLVKHILPISFLESVINQNFQKTGSKW